MAWSVAACLSQQVGPQTTESSYVPLYTKQVMYFWQISTYYTQQLLFSILWFYLLHEYLLINHLSFFLMS